MDAGLRDPLGVREEEHQIAAAPIAAQDRSADTKWLGRGRWQIFDDTMMEYAADKPTAI